MITVVKYPPKGSRHIANYFISKSAVELEYINGMDMILPNKATFYYFLDQKRRDLKAATIYSVSILNSHKIYMIENEKSMLLGINGEIGCGKSTAVDYIAKKYGFREYMFAKPLKDIAVTLGFEHNQVFGTQEQKLEINKFWGISGRQFLQVFGSEVCRDYMPKVLPNMQLNGVTLWARLFEKYMIENPNCNIAVSDVRFIDECNIIRKHGGLVIRIERPGQSNNSGIHTHQSETQKITPNVVVYNNGSLADLHRKLDIIMDGVINDKITTNTTNVVI